MTAASSSADRLELPAKNATQGTPCKPATSVPVWERLKDLGPLRDRRDRNPAARAVRSEMDAPDVVTFFAGRLDPRHTPGRDPRRDGLWPRLPIPAGQGRSNYGQTAGGRPAERSKSRIIATRISGHGLNSTLVYTAWWPKLPSNSPRSVRADRSAYDGRQLPRQRVRLGRGIPILNSLLAAQLGELCLEAGHGQEIIPLGVSQLHSGGSARRGSQIHQHGVGQITSLISRSGHSALPVHMRQSDGAARAGREFGRGALSRRAAKPAVRG